jgi:hypothetical protein
MTTGDWPAIYESLESKDFHVGDFMNVVRRTANLLDKMADMKSLPEPLQAKIKSAREKLLQPPIKESINVSG